MTMVLEDVVLWKGDVKVMFLLLKKTKEDIEVMLHTHVFILPRVYGSV